MFKHLKRFDVGYFEHMWGAVTFFARCVLWAGQVLIHAFIPDLFTNTAERMKQEIYRRERMR
jgi:hypothetical protein